MGKPKPVGSGEIRLRNPYTLPSADSPVLAERADAMGYRLRSVTQLTADGWLRCCWLEWTDAALEQQGFTGPAADYFGENATTPPPLDFDHFRNSAAHPWIAALWGRQPDLEDDYPARYHAAAVRLTDDDGLIRGEHVAELQARDAALWQRVEWDTARLAADDGMEGWLRVAYREMQIVYKRHAEAGEDEKSESLFGSWRHFRDRIIGGGTAIPDAMFWAKRLLDREIGLDDEFLRGQLSGLAYLLYRREPVLLRLVEARDALDVNTLLLDAAVLNYSPLSDKALSRAEASRKQPGNPDVIAGAIPDDIVDQMERTARELHAENPEHYGIRRRGAYLPGNVTAELADRFPPYTETGIAGRLRPRFKARPLGDS